MENDITSVPGSLLVRGFHELYVTIAGADAARLTATVLTPREYDRAKPLSFTFYETSIVKRGKQLTYILLCEGAMIIPGSFRESKIFPAVAIAADDSASRFVFMLAIDVSNKLYSKAFFHESSMRGEHPAWSIDV